MPDYLEKVDLPDGQWVWIRTLVTRRIRKAIRATSLQQTLRAIHGNGAPSDLTDTEALKAYMLAHPEAMNPNADDDAYLLHGIASWSFPGPVTLEALDDLPDAYTETVLQRLRELYGEPTEEVRKN